MINPLAFMRIGKPTVETPVAPGKVCGGNDQSDKVFRALMSPPKQQRQGTKPGIQQPQDERLDHPEPHSVSATSNSKVLRSIELASEMVDLPEPGSKKIEQYGTEILQPAHQCDPAFVSLSISLPFSVGVAELPASSKAATFRRSHHKSIDNEPQKGAAIQVANSSLQKSDSIGSRRMSPALLKASSEPTTSASIDMEANAPQPNLQTIIANTATGQDQALTQASNQITATTGARNSEGIPAQPEATKSHMPMVPAYLESNFKTHSTPKSLRVHIDDPELGKISVLFGSTAESMTLSVTSSGEEMPLAVAEVQREMKIWLNQANFEAHDGAQTNDALFHQRYDSEGSQTGQDRSGSDANPVAGNAGRFELSDEKDRPTASSGKKRSNSGKWRLI